jgi:hypothetical protein
MCGGRIGNTAAAFGEIDLMAAVAADGLVIVPEASEGHPQDASVTVSYMRGVTLTDSER